LASQLIASLFLPSFPVDVYSKRSVTNKNLLDFAHTCSSPECRQYTRYQVMAVTTSSFRGNSPASTGTLP
ncbi:hypothetical protein M2T75_30150, partial [Klebsiella pneumoniae]|nr:hypothetical protein [Klebsiella pneumoniae]